MAMLSLPAVQVKTTDPLTYSNDRWFQVSFLQKCIISKYPPYPVLFCILSYKVSHYSVRNSYKWFSGWVNCPNESNCITNNFRHFCKPIWTKEWFICETGIVSCDSKQLMENTHGMIVELLTGKINVMSVFGHFHCQTSIY